MAENKSVNLALVENSITGIANTLRDGLPIDEYKIHPSLRLTGKQELVCLGLIHNGIAVAMTKIWTLREQSTIAFSFALPSTVSPQGIAYVENHVFVHQTQPEHWPPKLGLN
ncbi:MAG TPA: hypothetical protein VJI33_00945 [Candidatus Paceibacterota bacterium]